VLSRNLGLKAAAVLVAIFIWGYVQLRGAESPVVRIFRHVVVEPVGAAPDIESRIRPSSVEVELRGSRADMEMISPVDVHAAVSMNKDQIGRYRGRVSVVAPKGIEATGRPEWVNVETWRPAVESLEVECGFTGQPAHGYEVSEAAVVPAAVEVKGKSGEVKRVWRVRVRVPIEGARGLVSSTIAPEALDRKGERVPRISITPRVVTATVSLAKRWSSRTVPVILRTSGSLPQGFRIASAEVYPAVVTVVGSPEALEHLMGVSTSPLDLKGLEGDVERRLSLVVPAGLNALETPEVVVRLRAVRHEPGARLEPRSGAEAP
jgi:YbbR domain-containing protein